MNKHHVIIGASAAGIAVANKLVQLEPDSFITCITKENELPYNKCLLADYLGGIKKEADTFLKALSFDSKKTLLRNTEIVAIKPESQEIICSDTTAISYDTLFLGMGSSPFIPPFMKNNWYPGVFLFHTLADAHSIIQYSDQKNIKNAVIIGAGLSGIECADALNKRGISITLIERSHQLLPHVLDSQSSDFLKKRIALHNATVYTNQNVTSLQQNKEQLCVQLDSGLAIEAPLVIVTTGLRPNIHLAQEAGIAVGMHGILVNANMQTNVPTIYAGGDVIQVSNLLTHEQTNSCLWPDAMLQGMHAAFAMTGQPKPYKGASLIMSSAFFGLDMAHAGILESPDSSDQLIIKAHDTYYHKYLLCQGKLKGFSVLGNAHNLGLLKRTLLTQESLNL